MIRTDTKVDNTIFAKIFATLIRYRGAATAGRVSEAGALWFSNWSFLHCSCNAQIEIKKLLASRGECASSRVLPASTGMADSYSVTTVLAISALGATLGLRFKVLVLLPAIAVGFIVSSGVGVGNGTDYISILFNTSLLIAALQTGYFTGTVARFGVERARSRKKSGIVRPTESPTRG